MARWILYVLMLSILPGCSREGSPTARTKPIVPDIEVVNADTPGERIDLDKKTVAGKTTLFEFFSEKCPACHDDVARRRTHR